MTLVIAHKRMVPATAKARALAEFRAFAAFRAKPTVTKLKPLTKKSAPGGSKALLRKPKEQQIVKKSGAGKGKDLRSLFCCPNPRRE